MWITKNIKNSKIIGVAIIALVTCAVLATVSTTVIMAQSNNPNTNAVAVQNKAKITISNNIAQLVTDGTITQAQADEVNRWINDPRSIFYSPNAYIDPQTLLNVAPPIFGKSNPSSSGKATQNSSLNYGPNDVIPWDSPSNRGKPLPNRVAPPPPSFANFFSNTLDYLVQKQVVTSAQAIEINGWINAAPTFIDEILFSILPEKGSI